MLYKPQCSDQKNGCRVVVVVVVLDGWFSFCGMSASLSINMLFLQQKQHILDKLKVVAVWSWHWSLTLTNLKAKYCFCCCFYPMSIQALGYLTRSLSLCECVLCLFVYFRSLTLSNPLKRWVPLRTIWKSHLLRSWFHWCIYAYAYRSMEKTTTETQRPTIYDKNRKTIASVSGSVQSKRKG